MTCEFTRCLHGPHGPHALRSGHHPQRLEERNLVPGAAWGCSNSWSKSYQECFATYTSIHTWHCFRNEHETRCACVNGGHSVVTAVFLEVGETPSAYERPKPAEFGLGSSLIKVLTALKGTGQNWQDMYGNYTRLEDCPTCIPMIFCDISIEQLL